VERPDHGLAALARVRWATLAPAERRWSMAAALLLAG